MTYHALLFLAMGSIRGRAGFVVVAAGRGIGDVLVLLFGLTEHHLARLVALLVPGCHLCHLLAVPPAGEADLAGRAVGLGQRFLLSQVRVRRDRLAG